MAQFRTAEMTVSNLNGLHYKLIYFEQDFTHLTSSGKYIQRCWTVRDTTFCPHSVFLFRLIRRATFDYFPWQNYWTILYREECISFLWLTDWSLIFYLNGMHILFITSFAIHPIIQSYIVSVHFIISLSLAAVFHKKTAPSGYSVRFSVPSNSKICPLHTK
jgi:hypothetical protein